ncbi:MAG TPA: ABC transporter ATP-binding protein [Candidatus Saccharimonadales bacterium]|nr:ABC transporter ATP-binding protein [Candidatus Saccharimonadales bacterium]
MPHATTAIAAKDVRVTRGVTQALDGVTFQIAKGRVTGLIGPSGSGKTTLIRSIIGAQHITSGRLEILGMPAGSKELRSRIGYVTQTPAVYDDLTVRQNVEYFAAILGVAKDEVKRVIAGVDLHSQEKRMVGSLSGGERARVSLAAALLGNPELLVLDEPTVGLDPVLRKHLWELFGNLAGQGQTLLISSHVMDEAEQCEALLLLRNGKLLHYGPKQELLRSTNTQTVHNAFLRLAEGEKI